MLPEDQIVIRLLVAAALGLVIGYERERQDHAAGLRTHMILVVGAALTMVISINLAFWFGPSQPAGDPARLAAQVVSSIGFLCGGVIFRYGTNVRGLTTAASLWTVTMVGLAIGAGFFMAGIVTTVILLIILTLLNYIEDNILPSYTRMHIIVYADYRPGLVQEVKELFKHKKRRVGRLDIERDKADESITLEAQVKIWKDDEMETLVDELASLPGTRNVKVTK